MTSSPNAPSVSRPGLRFALGISLSLGLLGALLLYLNISPRQIWDALREAPPLGLALVIAVHLFALIAKVARWGLLLRGSSCMPRETSGEEADPTLRHLVQDAVFLGWLGNLALPAKTGEMVRPLLFSRRSGMPFTRIFGTVVLERSLDLLVIALMFWASFTLFTVPDSIPETLVATSRLAGLGALLLLISLVVLWKLGPPESGQNAGNRGIATRVVNLLASFRSGLAGFQRPRMLVGVVAWTGASWALEVLGAWLCLLLFKVKLNAAWAAATMHVVATTLAVSVVPVPGGLGVEQPVTLAIFAPFAEGALPADTIIAVSLVLSFASIFWVLPLGLLGMWRQGARLNSQVANEVTAEYGTQHDD